MPELKRFFTTPVFEGDEEKTRRANVLSTILLSLMVVYVLAGFAVFFVFEQKLGSLLVIVVLLATLLVSRYLMQRRRLQFASLLLVSGMWAGVTLLVSLAGGMTSIDAAYYIIITVIAGLLLGARAAVGVAVVCSLTGLVMVVVEGLGYPFPRVFPVSATAGWLNLTFGLFLATIALNITLRSLHNALALARRQLEERKKAEETLRESEERYCLLAEAAHDLIFIVNREGNVDYANSFATQQFGRLPEEILGRPHAELFPSGDAERQQAGLRQVFEAGQPLYVESLTQFPSRSIWLGTWLVPIKDEAGQVKSVLGVSHDITERKQAEEEIHQLNAELEQRVIERTAQLEAAVKEMQVFSYSVSHDLRAPLRALNGFSSILMDEYAPQLPSDAARYLGIICDSARQMGYLVDGLLAFLRLGRQPLRKQPIDTVGLVRQALDSLSNEQAGRQVEISMGELPPCQGDSVLLRQVWINLLSNALKFTRGQNVTKIEIGCLNQESGAPVYFVKDNGVGFDMQYAGKLFGVFQRLHRAEEYDGTGVGLAIVQRIIHRHGGQVWAKAEVNRGATFYFAI